MNATNRHQELSPEIMTASKRYFTQIVHSTNNSTKLSDLRAQLKPINRSQHVPPLVVHQSRNLLQQPQPPTIQERRPQQHETLEQYTLTEQRPSPPRQVSPIPQKQNIPRRPVHSQEQPTSRFSWTTQATETTALQSPATETFSAQSTASTAASVTSPQHAPEPVSRFSWTTRDNESVVDTTSDFSEMRHLSLVPRPLAPIIARKRPIPRDVDGTRAPEQLAPTSSNKELPLSPPELASVDIITALEAQLEQLAHRKRNVEKLIHELTHLQPKNPLVQDLAARRENSRKLDALKLEMDEIRSMEHDLGLKHHRAWKRREQEQPTCLWVRRVTG